MELVQDLTKRERIFYANTPMPADSLLSFHLPNVPDEKKLTTYLSIMTKQHQELVPLRKEVTSYRLEHEKIKKERDEWKEKYNKVKEELQKTKKENNTLRQEIEKLTKTNSRYQVALFDHGNFNHSAQSKKKKGGQAGHSDTNREQQEEYASFKHKRIFAKTCGKCGCLLKRAKSIRRKILLDIVINPETVKLIIESERQWCRKCHKEVSAKDAQTLPFTEYGMNTFMLTMLLRFKAHASFSNIAVVMTISHGLKLSKSDVSNLLKAGAGFLGKRYENLKQAVRAGAVMYNDETGWLVHGQKVWMWIMATNDKKQIDGAGITVYVAAESRGKGIFADMYGNSKAYAMHDGYKGYESVTGKDNTLYCWAHVLRFCFEETVIEKKPTTIACHIRDTLVDLYQTIRNNPEWTKEKKEETLRLGIDSLLAIQSDDQTVQNIQYRVRTQRGGLILALLVTEDGTNNLSERELRNMAIKRSISNGSDTYQGMQTTAVIGSVLQTLHRNKKLPFLSTLKTYLSEGIQEKYPQYIHTAYSDEQ